MPLSNPPPLSHMACWPLHCLSKSYKALLAPVVLVVLEAAARGDPAAKSGERGPISLAPPPWEVEPSSGVCIVVEYCEPCGFEATYLELASAVKEQYPGIKIELLLGETGAFEMEINGQLIFSKLENGVFPYEKDLMDAIRIASNGEPLEKITNSRPPCVIL
ncbi:PREDICTED: migration and invasion enhancer 1-like [Chrysochloris asiatica]|uniref:Migration and invasion enhancer 1 n=1 Tax=Chrysochloris asiatica TaxID=185453 RepID=A0A9B0WR80_CHRAS|nr:PREDICTED: migration and invasion enhancer 1-like [Chrysochloris asiatica]